MAKIHVHAVSCNERELMPFFVAHYRDFVRAQRIVVHYDDSTTDGSDQLARELGVETIHHDRNNNADGTIPLDDLYLRDLRNTCWHTSRGQADWIIIVDVDELIIHPQLHVLLDATPPHIQVLEPEGWDLVGAWPAAGTQVWESVRSGVTNVDSNKPCIFRPDVDIELSIGSLAARHRETKQPIEIYNCPGLKLLHCVYLGRDFVLRKQAIKHGRTMTELNLQKNWGGHWRRDVDAVLRDWEDVGKRSVPIPDLPISSNLK